jgi:hypothetical protein
MNYLKDFNVNSGREDEILCLSSKAALANEDGFVDILGFHTPGVSPQSIDTNLDFLWE